MSYKCFEATCILPIARATGYGRTQTEAYKNGLRNLLELLMGDPLKTEYLSVVLKVMSTSGPNINHCLSVKVRMKTEGH